MKLLSILLILIMITGAGSAIVWDTQKLFSGQQMIPTGAPWVADNQKFYLGTDKDAYIWFNTDTGAAAISGITAVIDTGASIASGEDVVAVGGDTIFNFGTASGAFTTSTGTNTLSGNTVIAGSKTFTTGTGAIALNGDTTIAATKGITKTAGAGNFDFSAGTGTFLTSTGANTLSGDVTVASGKNFGMTGTGTFGTGTGQVSINGATVFAANKGVTVASGTSAFDFSGGSGAFKTSTGAATIGPGAVTVSGAATFSKTVDFSVNASTTLDTTLTSSSTKTIYPINASGASVTLTLPAADTVTGRMYVIDTLVDMGSNNIVVATTGGAKLGGVGGADTLTSTDILASLTVVSDGTNYAVISKIGTWT